MRAVDSKAARVARAPPVDARAAAAALVEARMRAPLDSSICPPLGVAFEPCEGVSHAQAPDPIAAANALRARRVDCERLVAVSAATPQALHAHLRVAIAVGSDSSLSYKSDRKSHKTI